MKSPLSFLNSCRVNLPRYEALLTAGNEQVSLLTEDHVVDLSLVRIQVHQLYHRYFVAWQSGCPYVPQLDLAVIMSTYRRILRTGYHLIQLVLE